MFGNLRTPLFNICSFMAKKYKLYKINIISVHQFCLFFQSYHIIWLVFRQGSNESGNAFYFVLSNIRQFLYGVDNANFVLLTSYFLLIQTKVTMKTHLQRILTLIGHLSTKSSEVFLS